MKFYTLNKNIICLFFIVINILAYRVYAIDLTSKVVKIHTEHVNHELYANPMKVSGILAYKVIRKVSFKGSGFVENIKVNETDQVNKNMVLATLDAHEINARVREAMAQLDLAKKNFTRREKLFEKKTISLKDKQESEAQLIAAQSRLDIALFSKQHSVLYAPSDGVVLKKMVEDTEQVAPNQQIFLIADASGGWVLKIGLTDKQIVQLSDNDEATVIFDALPGKVFKGNVSSIANVSDPLTGMFAVEICLEDGSNILKGGFVGEVTIIPKNMQKMALFPIESLRSITNNAAEVLVYNPKEKKVRIKKVSVDFIGSGFFASNTNFVDGMQVVTSGVSFLHDGESVLVQSN